MVFHDSEKAFRNMRYALPRTLERIRQMGARVRRSSSDPGAPGSSGGAGPLRDGGRSRYRAVGRVSEGSIGWKRDRSATACRRVSGTASACRIAVGCPPNGGQPSFVRRPEPEGRVGVVAPLRPVLDAARTREGAPTALS